MKSIYLDTCIWINYLWQTQFSEAPKRKSSSTKLIDRLKNQTEYEVIFSSFVMSEISSHFRDYYISQKIIRDGFSFRDLNREKKNYTLSDEENSFINQMIIEIGGCGFVNTLNLKSLDNLSEILVLEASYYFDFLDALHFQTAKESGCKFFITTDSPLRKSIDSHNKDNGIKLDCITDKKFLEKL